MDVDERYDTYVKEPVKTITAVVLFLWTGVVGISLYTNTSHRFHDHLLLAASAAQPALNWGTRHADVYIPPNPFLASTSKDISKIEFNHLIVWVLGCLGVLAYAITARRRDINRFALRVTCQKYQDASAGKKDPAYLERKRRLMRR